MKHPLHAGLVTLFASLAGLGCIASSSRPPDLAPPPDQTARFRPGIPPTVPPAERFRAALAELGNRDRADTWNPEACERIAGTFADLAAVGDPRTRLEALFNAGVAHERCGREDQARPLFERTLALNPSFHPAKVHLLLMLYRERGAPELDHCIAGLRTAAIVDARYQNLEALVALAMLSLDRDSPLPDADGPNDRARAARYLQSALAVDDSYAPAMNGLALYYLGEARSSAAPLSATAGAARTSLSSSLAAQSRTTQAMELAALVCAQGLQKDPRNPALHNTCGLIQVELGNLGKAAESFGQARKLRPGFYQAEMNYAAVNLQFRGFANAEEAYRAVLKARPDDYDARVGLALSLRGQIQPDTADTLADEAEKELERARKIAPERPEAYYNQALLTQAYKARGAGPETQKQLTHAQDLFRQFIAKAGTTPAYADTVKQAGERIREIDELFRFLGDGA